MVGAFEPKGMPEASEVVSFDPADDSLYLPVISLLDESLNRSGWIAEGDCKISAFDTRTHITKQDNCYLSP